MLFVGRWFYKSNIVNHLRHSGLSDFRLQARCKFNIRPSGMLRSVVTDVSGQRILLLLKGETDQED